MALEGVFKALLWPCDLIPEGGRDRNSENRDVWMKHQCTDGFAKLASAILMGWAGLG